MDYLEILENYREEMTEALAGIIRIRSVQEKPCAGPDGAVLPFGAGVEEVYQHMLALGRSMGFEVQDVDHYGGHIEWKAEDPNAETFGIAAHLDVVPEGTGWSREPYGAVIEDGWMYGRGTTDDKGPVIESLYAMKALRDAGFRPKKNIRLILGLDEETGKGGMDDYIEHAGMPDFGITPDGEFPLINGEMGILIFDLMEKLRRPTDRSGLLLSKLEGGDAPNIVPRKARAVLASQEPGAYDRIKAMAEAYAEESGHALSVRKAGTSLAVEATGVSAHGARPDLGLNAVSILMAFLGRLEFAADEVNEFIGFYNEHIGFDYNGTKIGCGFEDEPSGKLIFNVGLAEFTDEFASVTINIRYPVLCTGEEVYAGIESCLAGTRIGLLKKMHDRPVIFSTEDPFVETLLEAYAEETGDTEAKPLVIGGGTYAKSLRRTMAFGAAFPEDEDRMHQPDERLSLDAMMKAARIYARMLYKLCL